MFTTLADIKFCTREWSCCVCLFSTIDERKIDLKFHFITLIYLSVWMINRISMCFGKQVIRISEISNTQASAY